MTLSTQISQVLGVGPKVSVFCGSIDTGTHWHTSIVLAESYEDAYEQIRSDMTKSEVWFWAKIEITKLALPNNSQIFDFDTHPTMTIENTDTDTLPASHDDE